jgi:UDP-N-acetylglucosamine 2-epimerase
VKALIVGENGQVPGLDGALEAEGVEVERPPAGTLPSSGDDVAQIAAALIALERLLTEEGPDAVVLTSTSNVALAAVLVATKLRIPVAGLVNAPNGEDSLSEMNRRLIEQLADAMVAYDAVAIAAWVRDPATA